jgi:hypothetical protein
LSPTLVQIKHKFCQNVEREREREREREGEGEGEGEGERNLKHYASGKK